MKPMTYKVFTWLESPESFHIQAVRVPVYTIDSNGSFDYQGLGPMCRIISGSGVFRGEYAYENFNTLQVLMATGTPGDLVHPIWGTISAFLIQLDMKSEAGADYVEYSFSFREADESGSIPALPTDWQDQI